MGLPDTRRDSFIAPFSREWASSSCRHETEADRRISTSYRCITSGTDQIDAGEVFDLTLPLEQAAEGYRAMDERRATKVLLTF
jgi:hypothetical protein